MQDCFRQHPEMYGSELDDDEDELEEEIRAQEGAKEGDSPATASTEAKADTLPESGPNATQPTEPKKEVESPHSDDSVTSSEGAQKAGDEYGELVPKTARDATSK